MGRGGVLVLDFRKHQMPELLAHVAPVDVNLGEGSGLCTGEVERCAPPQREQVVRSGDKKAWRRVGARVETARWCRKRVQEEAGNASEKGR